MKNIFRRNAFTMIELIMAIVVIGILAAVMIPRGPRHNLRGAADQVLSHIRYTQHLAMQDNKFSTEDNDWFKKRWQIYFRNTEKTNNQWGYTIFSDTAGTSAGEPNWGEVARDPQNPRQYLTHGHVDGKPTEKKHAYKINNKINLGKTYGVKNIDIKGGCVRTSSQRIAFDYLGRPIGGNIAKSTLPYDDRLMKEDCNITITAGGSSANIIIVPETGYAYIQ